MGTTSTFIKSRESNNPKLGEWNSDYKTALAKAKKENKFIVTCWSNGDICGYCTTAENCMMTTAFKDWMKKQDAYFIFQYSGDKDKGISLYNWIFKDGKVKQFPGFRITLYDDKGNILVDHSTTGNKLRGNKTKITGANNMIKNLEAVFNKKSTPDEDEKDQPTNEYKIRLNEKLTTAQVNKILDAIDKAEGYCPCQPKSEDSKCHCKDFIENKKIGEPCICNIYCKQPK